MLIHIIKLNLRNLKVIFYTKNTLIKHWSHNELKLHHQTNRLDSLLTHWTEEVNTGLAGSKANRAAWDSWCRWVDSPVWAHCSQHRWACCSLVSSGASWQTWRIPTIIKLTNSDASDTQQLKANFTAFLGS